MNNSSLAQFPTTLFFGKIIIFFHFADQVLQSIVSTFSAYLTFSIGGQFLEKAGVTKLENLYKGIKVRHMYMYSRIEYSYVQAYMQGKSPWDASCCITSGGGTTSF
jgi:hypothetical protein